VQRSGIVSRRAEGPVADLTFLRSLERNSGFIRTAFRNVKKKMFKENDINLEGLMSVRIRKFPSVLFAHVTKKA
jgi:hypothetical protein